MSNPRQPNDGLPPGVTSPGGGGSGGGKQSTYDDFTALLAATAAAPGGINLNPNFNNLLGRGTPLTAATAAPPGGPSPISPGRGTSLTAAPGMARQLPLQPPLLSAGLATSLSAAGSARGMWPPPTAASTMALMNSLAVLPNASGRMMAPAATATDAFRLRHLDTIPIYHIRQQQSQQRQDKLQQELQQQKLELRLLQEEQDRRSAAPSDGHATPAVGEKRQSREEMLRSYREENADFYRELVDSVGQEIADEMVAEAVNETLKEEGKAEKEGPQNEGRAERGQLNGGMGARGVAQVEASDNEDGRFRHQNREQPAVIPQPQAGVFGTAPTLQTAPTHAPMMTAMGEPPFSLLYKSDAVASKKRGADVPTAMLAADPKRPRQLRLPADGNNLLQTLFPGGTSPNPGQLAAGMSLGQLAASTNLAAGLSLGEILAKSTKPVTLVSAAGERLGATKSTKPVTLVSTTGERLGAVSGPAARTALSTEESKKGEGVPLGLFESDPEFCQLLFAAASKAPSQTVGEDASVLLMRGLLHIDDLSLHVSPETDTALPLKAYVKDFVEPSNISEIGGKWTAIIHSDDGHHIVRNMIYQRRKAMKGAAELVFRAMKSEQSQPVGGGKKDGPEKERAEANKTSIEKDVATDPGKDHLLAELMNRLASEKTQNEKTVANMQKKLREEQVKHERELDETEGEYKKIVSDLMNSHRKEIQDLKKQMRTQGDVHKTFLESYVEASLDALRNNGESPTLE